MTPADLERVLAALRFVQGERFELAVPAPTKGFIGRHFGEPGEAVDWYNALPESNAYICLNPVKPEAPQGRAGANDIASVRTLLIDIDTGDPPSPKTVDATDPHGVAPAKRAAAREVAQQILEWLVAEGCDRPTWVDSGRGNQLWLGHEPLELGAEQIKSRVALVRALAAEFNRKGLCHVDTGRTGSNQLARLPGTKNMKTGAIASLVEGEVTTW